MDEILQRLARGELSVEEAIRVLGSHRQDLVTGKGKVNPTAKILYGVGTFSGTTVSEYLNVPFTTETIVTPFLGNLLPCS